MRRLVESGPRQRFSSLLMQPKANGQLTDALFSPFITELAKEISGDDNPTIDDKVKALVNLLTVTKDFEGKPLFANREAAVKALRKSLGASKKRNDESSWYKGYVDPSDYSALTFDEAEQILKDAGVEPKEDGSNSEQVGTTLTEVSLRSLGGAVDPQATLLNPEGYKALLASLNGTPMPLDTQLSWIQRLRRGLFRRSLAARTMRCSSRLASTRAPGQQTAATPVPGMAIRIQVMATSIGARSPVDVATACHRLRWTSSGAGSWPRRPLALHQCCGRWA